MYTVKFLRMREAVELKFLKVI